MDSLFDARTGVIIPVCTTAYGLLHNKDRLGARGQTRLKHQEKGRKTPEKKLRAVHPWRVLHTNTIYNLPISQRTYLSGK